MRSLTKGGEEGNEGREIATCDLQLGFRGLTVIWRNKRK